MDSSRFQGSIRSKDYTEYYVYVIHVLDIQKILINDSDCHFLTYSITLKVRVQKQPHKNCVNSFIRQ